MNLKRLSSEAGGKMHKGDIIVKIDEDDISEWTLARGTNVMNSIIIN
jgi:membrane-associated protease RseP (regulator of RpoE activity)